MPGDQRVRLSRLPGQQQRHQVAGGVQPAAALLGLGEPPRVGDRRAGRRGQRDGQLLIFCAELPATVAFGEVKVAEDFLPDADRDTEEAGHRRMSRRETRRRRMSGQVSKPDRDRLAGQQAQDPPARGQVADPRDQLAVHADVHELLKSPVAAQDAERRVPGAEQIPGRFHDLPQHHRQAQLPRYQRVRAQQPAQPPLGGEHVIGAVHQLRQQLIQFQPRRVRKTQSATASAPAPPGTCATGGGERDPSVLAQPIGASIRVPISPPAIT